MRAAAASNVVDLTELLKQSLGKKGPSKGSAAAKAAKPAAKAATVEGCSAQAGVNEHKLASLRASNPR